MEFTFWENKALQLPRGPLWGTLGFVAAILLFAVLGTIASRFVKKEVVKSTAPTLQELEQWEKIISSKDAAKINELLHKEGARIGADMSKWALVSGWQNETLMELYQQDLLYAVRGQIEALRKAEAEKAQAAASGSQGQAASAAKP